jgi:glycosyltransferase involved in cell wall biosynthesis
VSFGVPVRNGGDRLPKLLRSLLGQTLRDVEVVVCDNCSDDGTPELVQRFAAEDPRVRFHANGTNLGQIGNFNRVLELARGTYFRWIGADDWLEPEYAERCIECFTADPGLVGVTTLQDHVDDAGRRHFVEYVGPRLESPKPWVRARRMLWFHHSDYGHIDPIYTIMRRETLMGSHRLQMVPCTDHVLALEMALLGRFGHVPQCLSHRRREYIDASDAVLQRYHPTRYAELRVSTFKVSRAFAGVVRSMPIPARCKALCGVAIARWAAVRLFRTNRERLREAMARVLRPVWRRWRRRPPPLDHGSRTSGGSASTVSGPNSARQR